MLILIFWPDSASFTTDWLGCMTTPHAKLLRRYNSCTHPLVARYSHQGDPSKVKTLSNRVQRYLLIATATTSCFPQDVVANLQLGAGGVQDRKQFALKIANDLFRFMSSFSQATQAGPEVMVVPTNVLDR